MKVTPYRTLVCDIADRFTNGDHVSPQDLPPLSDDDLSIIINHDDGVGYDACRPGAYADLLNSAVLTTHNDRIMALGHALHQALTYEARDYLRGDVNTELAHRDEASSDLPDMPDTESASERDGAASVML